MAEIRHLRYFVAVAEELNFSRAAERLHMAQPPLSVAIRQLEQELGTPLLTRTTRDVSLTPAGSAFLAGARATLAELDRSIADARRASSGKVGRLRIAFSWGARFVTLPAVGQAFRASHPDVELLTEEMWNAKMAEALRSGQIDLAVSICPEITNGLSYDTIRSERIVALVATDHALAGATEIELEELAEDGFVMFPRELAPRLYEALVGACRRAGFEPKVRSDSFHTSWELGVLGDVPGVALVPESVTRGLPAGLVALELPEQTDRVDTAILSREGRQSAAAAAFCSAAHAVFEAERAALGTYRAQPDS
jgi:LysR family transcriptional regulator, benzoate and cis,cis-muconate-responsive activator of ben and cat genes